MTIHINIKIPSKSRPTAALTGFFVLISLKKFYILAAIAKCSKNAEQKNRVTLFNCAAIVYNERKNISRCETGCKF